MVNGLVISISLLVRAHDAPEFKLLKDEQAEVPVTSTSEGKVSLIFASLGGLVTGVNFKIYEVVAPTVFTIGATEAVVMAAAVAV